MPESFILKEKEQIKEKNGVKIIKYVPIVAKFTPLSKVFKKLLELPFVCDKIMEYRGTLLKNAQNINQNSKIFSCSCYLIHVIVHYL